MPSSDPVTEMNKNVEQTPKGYYFIGVFTKAGFARLPANCVARQPAYDRNNNELDSRYVAVYKESNDVFSTFKDYIRGLS